MDLTSFTIDNNSLASWWLIREASWDNNSEHEKCNCRSVVEHGQIDFDTHVVIFYPIHLVGGDQVDERERQHRDGDKDHQTFDQTAPENATLRAISSHEAVGLCERSFHQNAFFRVSTASKAATHSRGLKFNLAPAFCSLTRSCGSDSARATKAITGELFWTRSCTQLTNSTIIDDSDSRLVFYKQMQIIRRCALVIRLCLRDEKVFS